MTDTMETRVARGILWLDYMHVGWRDKVDLDVLDITDSHGCILGQVFGYYSDALTDEIHGDYETADDMARSMGFDIMPSEFRADHKKYYAQLEQLWADALSV